MPPSEENPGNAENGGGPSGGVTASHPVRDRLPFFVAPSLSGKEKNTLRDELVTVACWKLNDVRFLFGSSFVLPQTRGEFLELLQLRKEHAGAPLSVFGHADPVNDDVFNKLLSGHRAEAVYATLVREPVMWEKLFNGGGQAEGWGMVSIQHMLEALGFNPGPLTGSMNPQTKAAVKDFQGKNELNDDGDPGKLTREKLFAAYMTFLCPNKIEKSEFLGGGVDPKGKGDYQGCSEFNPIMRFSKTEEAEFNKPANRQARNEENAINRRVMVLFFKPGTTMPLTAWPCPRTVEGIQGCRNRFFASGDKNRSAQATRRTFSKTENTFACRFYHRLVEISPCEGILPPPVPVLDGVSPIIFFKEAAASTEVGVAVRVVVVEKPHTSLAIDDVDVELTTDVPFDGTGTFTVSPAGKLNFFRAGTKILFNGTDNVFTGAELTSRLSLLVQATAPSDTIDDISLTLTLAGGSKKRGGPAVVQLTSVEVTLDICEPRTSPTVEPVPLTQPASATPAASPPPKDKFFGGRGLLVQNTAKTNERAMLIVRKVKPAEFKGNMVLTTVGDHVKAFENEVPVDGELPIAARLVFPASDVKAAEKKLFAEGVSVSTAVRDASFQLGVEGFDEDADAVRITVVGAEIVSDVEPKDLKIIDRADETPERKTKSKFFPAPIIVGTNYDIRLRPHTELPGGAQARAFLWSSPVPAAALTLADTAKEVVKVKSLANSAALDDLSIDVVIDSDIGKFKTSHKFTSVTVEIDPYTIDILHPNRAPTLASDINFIQNPAVTPILGAAAGADPTEVPIIRITRIRPDLGFTEDDPRIAWWIIGDQPAEAGKAKYEGRAFFLNTPAAEQGTKVQISGRVKGDILVQPYSGGFGYGMFRTNVEPLHRIKYRVNRIITDATATLPAVVPTRSHADAKNHIRMANIYLRQMGLELVPDDSAEVAKRTGNKLVGLAELDSSIVSVNRVEAGHFDVKVNDQKFTFQATDEDADSAVRINARNEVIVFAYINSLASGNTVRAQAQLWPHNHAPSARKDPPSATTRIMPDSGTPSTSLIPKTGIPPDTPAGTINLNVMEAFFVSFKSSQKERHKDLLWGIGVPTTSMDNSNDPTAPEASYGATFAHEFGHALGLNHRISTGDGFPDGLDIPFRRNLMFPNFFFPTRENFDIIQCKTVRFSEILFRNP